MSRTQTELSLYLKALRRAGPAQKRRLSQEALQYEIGERRTQYVSQVERGLRCPEPDDEFLDLLAEYVKGRDKTVRRTRKQIGEMAAAGVTRAADEVGGGKIEADTGGKRAARRYRLLLPHAIWGAAVAGAALNEDLGRWDVASHWARAAEDLGDDERTPDHLCWISTCSTPVDRSDWRPGPVTEEAEDYLRDGLIDAVALPELGSARREGLVPVARLVDGSVGCKLVSLLQLTHTTSTRLMARAFQERIEQLREATTPDEFWEALDKVADETGALQDAEGLTRFLKLPRDDRRFCVAADSQGVGLDFAVDIQNRLEESELEDGGFTVPLERLPREPIDALTLRLLNDPSPRFLLGVITWPPLTDWLRPIPGALQASEVGLIHTPDDRPTAPALACDVWVRREDSSDPALLAAIEELLAGADRCLASLDRFVIERRASDAPNGLVAYFGLGPLSEEPLAQAALHRIVVLAVRGTQFRTFFHRSYIRLLQGATT